MKSQMTLIRSAMLLLVVGTPGYSAEPDNGQGAAIAAIKKLGGGVDLDRNKAVAFVFFPFGVTDAGLEHVKGMKSLQRLDLYACTNVTDAGLENLKGWFPISNAIETRK